MKRFVDIVFAAIWLLRMAPVMTLIAILIKLDSPGPILYVPRMVGQNGKVFPLFRFRTLSIAAGHRPTRVGGLLRHYSLDHLPTLINLLRGELTLVGPRPMEVPAVNLHDPAWQQYFQHRPGLFNYAVLKLGKLWTPSRLSHPTLNQELELAYRQKQSAIVDWPVLVQFFSALVASRGNVKARGKPDPEVESRLSNHQQE